MPSEKAKYLADIRNMVKKQELSNKKESLFSFVNREIEVNAQQGIYEISIYDYQLRHWFSTTFPEKTASEFSFELVAEIIHEELTLNNYKNYEKKDYTNTNGSPSKGKHLLFSWK